MVVTGIFDVVELTVGFNVNLTVVFLVVKVVMVFGVVVGVCFVVDVLFMIVVVCVLDLVEVGTLDVDVGFIVVVVRFTCVGIVTVLIGVVDVILFKPVFGIVAFIFNVVFTSCISSSVTTSSVVVSIIGVVELSESSPDFHKEIVNFLEKKTQNKILTHRPNTSLDNHSNMSLKQNNLYDNHIFLLIHLAEQL